jgi:hypothetical protein
MSSFGNHVWTPEREQVAHRLVALARDCDDDGFAEAIYQIHDHGGCHDMLAVTALLAELAAGLVDGEDEDRAATAANLDSLPTEDDGDDTDIEHKQQVRETYWRRMLHDYQGIKTNV